MTRIYGRDLWLGGEIALFAAFIPSPPRAYNIFLFSNACLQTMEAQTGIVY